MSSSKQTDSTRLSFNSQQDSLNYVDHLVQDSRSWLANNNVNIVDRYEKCELEIALQFLPMWGTGELYLIIRAIPLPGYERERSIFSNTDSRSKASYTHKYDGLMFIGITQFVQGPQQIIPSYVWFAV